MTCSKTQIPESVITQLVRILGSHPSDPEYASSCPGGGMSAPNLLPSCWAVEENAGHQWNSSPRGDSQSGRHRYTQCGDRLQNVEFATGPKIPTVLWSTSGAPLVPGEPLFRSTVGGQHPLLSSWLGNSALTRATRVRVPVAEYFAPNDTCGTRAHEGIVGQRQLTTQVTKASNWHT